MCRGFAVLSLCSQFSAIPQVRIIVGSSDDEDFQHTIEVLMIARGFELTSRTDFACQVMY
jgi:hypothetical protein